MINYRSTTPLERIIIDQTQKTFNDIGYDVSLSPLASFLQHLRDLLSEPSFAEKFCADASIEQNSLEQWLIQDTRRAYTQGIKFLKKEGIAVPNLVEDRAETFSKMIRNVKNAGFDGLVLLIDELSEFFRSKADSAALNEDARTLQLLGEITRETPLWIVSAVQESIERTGDIAQATFRKIKDRFPVRLLLSTLHIRDLIGKRLIRHKMGAERMLFELWNTMKKNYDTFNTSFEEFFRIYPVHPLTLSLLEGLGDLFSQHRGIVDFIYSRIAGDPQRQIKSILNRPAAELLSPDSIYDHFCGRIAEFSAFNIYPRIVVPHLDQIIETTIETDGDRSLARRLIRILVLYAIHPSAKQPTLRTLSALSGFALSVTDPTMNAQFISEAILDPLVSASRFLSKMPSESGNIFDAIYLVNTREDHSKTLKGKIERIMGELGPDDSRILEMTLAELDEPACWPGSIILKQPQQRTVTWRQSQRRVFVAYCGAYSYTKTLRQCISTSLKNNSVDCAFVIVTSQTDFSADHTAVWRIGKSLNNSQVQPLREYVACMLLRSELRPENPADIPLIPMVEDTMNKLRPLK